MYNILSIHSNLTTKYYTANLLVRSLHFESLASIESQLEALPHKESTIFILESTSSDAFVKECLSLNDKFDCEVSILFYSLSGDSKIDENYEGHLNKIVFQY